MSLVCSLANLFYSIDFGVARFSTFFLLLASEFFCCLLGINVVNTRLLYNSTNGYKNGLSKQQTPSEQDSMSLSSTLSSLSACSDGAGENFTSSRLQLQSSFLHAHNNNNNNNVIPPMPTDPPPLPPPDYDFADSGTGDSDNDDVTPTISQQNLGNE